MIGSDVTMSNRTETGKLASALEDVQGRRAAWIKVLAVAIITGLIISCKPTTRSFENDICYVIWDGKTFVKGKTSGDDFVRHSIARYGLKVLVVSIPKEMNAYFGAKDPKVGDKSPPDLQKFIIEDNLDRISLMCGFQR
jgi:hypothetical protein